MKKTSKFITLTTIFLFTTLQMFAQVEVEPWGNITGIRIDGQLMEFQSNLTVVSNNGNNIKATAKERQKPHYNRNDDTQIIITNIDSLYFKEKVTDVGKHTAVVNVTAIAKADMTMNGAYFSLVLPGTAYAGGVVRINHLKPIIILDKDLISINRYLRKPADSVEFISSSLQLKIVFEKPITIIVKSIDENNKNIHVYIPIKKGNIKAGQTFARKFSITASGVVNKKPITLQLNTVNPGYS